MTDDDTENKMTVSVAVIIKLLHFCYRFIVVWATAMVAQTIVPCDWATVQTLLQRGKRRMQRDNNRSWRRWRKKLWRPFRSAGRDTPLHMATYQALQLAAIRASGRSLKFGFALQLTPTVTTGSSCSGPSSPFATSSRRIQSLLFVHLLWWY